MKCNIAFISLTQLICVSVKCSEILMLTPFGSKSHKNVFLPLAEGLVKNGHHVTLISGFVPSETISNLTELSFPDLEPFFALQKTNLIKEGKDGFTYEVLSEYQDILRNMCIHFFKHGPLLKWIKDGHQFDLVLADAVLNECVIPLAHELGRTTMLMNTCNLVVWVTRPMNIPSPYSYIPFSPLPLRSKMDFWERFQNAYVIEIWDLLERWYSVPKTDQLVREYLPNAKSYHEAMSSFDFVLVNADPVFNIPRPSMPYVADVGGMHCRPAKPLPKHLNDYVESSGEDGFIIFSLGSIFDDSMMTADKKEAFLSAFSRLKQKVLWKFEQKVEGLPENVRIFKWLPQQDLLGHPKVRAFITHGGLLSLQESIYHGVPMVGIPLFADQPSNVAVAEEQGVAVGLNLAEVTADSIYDAVTKACTDPRMKEAAKTKSLIFRDRQREPVHTAIYWTEYVLRHNGARHLRSAAHELNTAQYFLLDVIAFILVVIFVAGWLLVAVLRFALKMYSGKKYGVLKKTN